MAQQAFGFVGLWFGLMVVPSYIIRIHGGNLRSELHHWAKLPKDAVLGVSVGLASQFLLLPLIYLPLRALIPDIVEQVSAPAEALVAQVEGWRFLAFYMLAGIAAPVFEELYFRGFAYRMFVERYGPKITVLVTAVIFGLYHFQGIQTLGLVLAGIVFAVLRWKTGRMGPSIFAHAAFNGATLWILFLR